MNACAPAAKLQRIGKDPRNNTKMQTVEEQMELGER